ncbi:MAG: mandelate racemase/muconate lactonizing enzyme family protein [Acetobacteraceae bacterium]|nr:mandelate racemase/muconate lactonizing enzyme family protein [Acetobacteraceae bacterium]
MKIERADIYIAPTGNRRAVLLELTTDRGITGIGEAGVAYGIGQHAAAEMLRAMIGRHVLGRDARRIGAIWNDLYDLSFWTRNGGAICYAALSAIEHALWDIKGKALSAPVHELLGGAMRDELLVYANGWWVGCDTPEEFARAGAATVARGFSGLKLYPLGLADPVTVVRHPTLRSLDSRVVPLVCDRVAALREAVGPDIGIMLDFGGGLTTDQVLRICRRLEPFDVLFIEEAVDPSAPDAMAAVAAGTTIAMAAGERCFGRAAFDRLLQCGVRIAQPDICNTGGLLEARMIAGMAEARNVRVAPHNYGSTLASAITAQLSAAIPNFMVLEFFPDYDREPGYLEVLENPLEPQLRNGRVPVPAAPGLGVALDRTALAPHHHAACVAGRPPGRQSECR